MKDTTLLRTALLCSIIGVVALFLISRGIEIEVQPIERLQLMQDKDIAVEGKVKSIAEKKGLTIVEVGYDTSMKVVLFEHPDLRLGDSVMVRGEIQEYNGELEIVGSELRVS